MARILVQHRRTEKFLADDNRWTTDAARARNFQNTLSALAHCFQYDLAQAQIVVKWPEPNACDAVIPVRFEPRLQ